MNKEIDYWEPRVMRHHRGHNGDVYCIHEVYFDKENNVVSYTEDALTPKKASISDLKNYLLGFLNQRKEEFILGDSTYTYSREDIKYWLDFIDEPPINFGNK